jgi:pimeloyl-ACP methyl ester carboxylesterase
MHRQPPVRHLATERISLMTALIAKPAPTAPSSEIVTSRDGTRIAFRSIGDGPAIVVLHGAMETAQSHLDLAAELAARARIVLPDRRGRGGSGPARPDDGIAHQIEDLQAVIAATGARALIGVSAGALVALEAARTLPELDRVALFEPPLSIDGSIATEWLDRFDAEIAAGRTAGALVTGMLAAEMGPPWMLKLPRPVLELMTSAMLRMEDHRPPPNGVAWRTLAPTLHTDARIVADMDGPLARFADVRPGVLLIGGSASPMYLRRTLDTLESALPHARRVELAGLDHGAASNRDQRGHPEVVAAQLRPFFGLD